MSNNGKHFRDYASRKLAPIWERLKGCLKRTFRKSTPEPSDDGWDDSDWDDEPWDENSYELVLLGTASGEMSFAQLLAATLKQPSPADAWDEGELLAQAAQQLEDEDDAYRIDVEALLEERDAAFLASYSVVDDE